MLQPGFETWDKIWLIYYKLRLRNCKKNIFAHGRNVSGWLEFMSLKNIDQIELLTQKLSTYEYYINYEE